MSWRWPSKDVSDQIKRLESALRDHAGHLDVLIAAAEVKSLNAEQIKTLVPKWIAHAEACDREIKEARESNGRKVVNETMYEQTAIIYRKCANDLAEHI